MVIVNENERKKIIPIASGKGGVGKTLIATNISIRLAQQGRKVLLVDMDLGGSNAHTFLRIKNQHYGIANYIHNKEIAFHEIIQETAYRNLHFIAGDALSPGVATIASKQLQDVLHEITTLPYDYIILDTASGSRSMSLNTFSVANSGILVITPDITSVLNAYNFFKNAVFNIMFHHAMRQHRSDVTEYLQSIMEEQSPNSTPKINEVLLKVERIDSGASVELREQIYCMKPLVILNGFRDADDLECAHNLQSLIFKNMNIELECLGVIFEDATSIRRATAAQVPLIQTELESQARDDIDRIAQKILLSPDFPILPLDLEMYDDTFGLVAIEVQHSIEQQSPDSAALEREEYLALIESLKQKITELEGGEPQENSSQAAPSEKGASPERAPVAEPTPPANKKRQAQE